MDYRHILDSLPDLIYVTTSDGATSTFYNKAWYDYTGLTEEETLQGWQVIIDPRDLERVVNDVRKASEAETCYEIELRLLHKKSGEYRWFLSRGCPVKDETGKLVAYVGTSVDIHERKTQIRDMSAVYERVAAERLEKIKQLESQLSA